MSKTPTNQEIVTAIAWLDAFEGEAEPENARDITRVAVWLREFVQDRVLKTEAKKAGVPIAYVRKRLQELS